MKQAQDFLSWLAQYLQNRLKQISKGYESNKFTEYATLLEILKKLKGQ